MTYQFARIDLDKNTDRTNVDWYYITDPDVDQLNDIYRTYCIYKHFASVMPIFDSQYKDPDTDIIGYREDGKLVAFSLMKRYDDKNVLASQFAWTYHNPKTRLGVESLKTECAIYRERGFKYLYLDQAHLYKQGIEGFELLGPLQ
jgi:uncharacterized protein (DUF427 family)